MIAVPRDRVGIHGCAEIIFLKEGFMKCQNILIALAWLLIASGSLMPGVLAQAVNESHWIGRIDNNKKDSAEYLARTPYILHWRVDPKYKLYGDRDPTVKVESYLAGIYVYDAATGNDICSSSNGKLTGAMVVPVGGKHRVKVFCTAPLELSFEEDRATLESAARRGELKEDKTVADAKAESPRTKNEAIQALKEGMLKKIRDDRPNIGEDVLAAIRADIDKAAQLASSPDDFIARFKALSAITEANLANRKPPEEVSIPQPAPSPHKWDGKGTPPGMTRKSGF